MSKQRLKKIKHQTDRAGIAIVTIPVSNKQCTLFEDDFNALISLGLSPLWSYDKGKGVVAWLKRWRRWGSLARIVVDAAPGTNVIFKDGNKLNLRRDNLITTDHKRGGSRLRYRDGIEATYKWPNKVEHVYLTNNKSTE